MLNKLNIFTKLKYKYGLIENIEYLFQKYLKNKIYIYIFLTLIKNLELKEENYSL